MGLPCYATWTSPIRKYGDLVNHRLLKAFISDTDPVEIDVELPQMLIEQRKRQRLVERRVSEWLYALYLKEIPDPGKIFLSEIIDVAFSGVRVRLQENGARAFIPQSFLCDDRMRLQCDNEQGVIRLDGKDILRVGDTLSIQLAEVKVETRSIVAKPVTSLG